ncbi:DoxX family protein [Mycolicibacterium mengxianglii]|uniref:DoxX family protein n=1 Tax=Mycolicibacterium mengxianglii TaxID=2736649 RepID=UPI0018CFEF7B|nr:DoxX family protein [Mycolicibacterium mengxianglii]
MDLGLLLVRLVVGAILFAHATQKLWGWFSGPGITGATTLFHSLGQRPAQIMVRVAAGCELLGAALLVAGAATPLGVLIAVSTMLVAGASLCLLKGTLWNSAGGGEYPFVLAAMTVVIAFTGPGRWSVDAAMGAWWTSGTELRGVLLGFGVVAVATVAAAPAVIRTRRVLAAQAP